MAKEERGWRKRAHEYSSRQTPVTLPSGTMALIRCTPEQETSSTSKETIWPLVTQQTQFASCWTGTICTEGSSGSWGDGNSCVYPNFVRIDFLQDSSPGNSLQPLLQTNFNCSFSQPQSSPVYDCFHNPQPSRCSCLFKQRALPEQTFLFLSFFSINLYRHCQQPERKFKADGGLNPGG